MVEVSDEPLDHVDETFNAHDNQGTETNGSKRVSKGSSQSSQCLESWHTSVRFREIVPSTINSADRDMDHVFQHLGDVVASKENKHQQSNQLGVVRATRSLVSPFHVTGNHGSRKQCRKGTHDNKSNSRDNPRTWVLFHDINDDGHDGRTKRDSASHTPIRECSDCSENKENNTCRVVSLDQIGNGSTQSQNDVQN
ncbi:hypothetical protein OGAPHI_003972 [Ogataea philodendri]|uniref:Uncharacterized protein n=1 Tax=Ogataea philodendri TaxID=1378263 RepID=A0A9P8P6D4_9ASCO|nr:uncharacterized protein OGAPHI_003972 [Ogataea philodendri]KAH3665784.1 hypothetical protein OGAPHI_003972 [Ogataea philodendri]